MSKPRVVKAVFYRRGMQVGEITGSFLSGTADEEIRRSMIETYHSLQRAKEDGTLPPEDDEILDEANRELEEQIHDMMDSPDQVLNLAEDGREEYGSDG